MLGKTVIFNVHGLGGKSLPRVAIITKVYEDETVGLSVLSEPEDTSHPLDYPVKRYKKVKLGDGLGECQMIDPYDALGNVKRGPGRPPKVAE